MTTTLLTAPADPSAPRAARRVTQRSVVRAEWIKFSTVRSNLITLTAAGLVALGLGALFSSLAGSGEALPPNAAQGADSLTVAFAGLNLSQLVLGVLGALFVAGEYSSGLIRTMFAAVADRLPVLWAKTIVLGASTWVVMTAASFAAFFAGQALYGGAGATYAITDPGVLRAVLGAGFYGAGVVVMGMALGFLLRSTAGAIGTLVATLMIAPVLVNLLPDALSSPLSKMLPSNAGEAFRTVSANSDLLSPSAGFAVFVAWIVVLVAAAAVLLRRRDA